MIRSWFVGASMLALALTAPVLSQQMGVATCRLGAERGSGQITGRVLAATTGEPIASRMVGIREPGRVEGPSFVCGVQTAEDGSFRIDSIPSGAFEFVVGSVGYRHVAAVPVTVAPDTVIVLTFRLRSENLAADCAESPGCAPLMVASADLRDVMFLTTLGLIRGPTGETEQWIACLEDADAAMVGRIQALAAYAVSNDDCGLRDLGQERRVFHRPTGNQAYQVHLGDPVFETPDRVEAKSGYHVGPLWGATWGCRYERIAGLLWRATWCRLEVIY